MVMSHQNLHPKVRRALPFVALGVGLYYLARQLVWTAGLVVLAALVVFLFDLDALLRFVFRFSAQYVEGELSEQAMARHWIIALYAALNVGLILLRSLNLIFKPKSREGDTQ